MSGASSSRVAVVGAGISGLACARRLLDAGFDVAVFDKSRGLGGRMSTRRGDGVAFDHGAQYFTAKDPEFLAQVREWQAQEVAAEWRGRVVTLREGVAQPAEAVTRFVGVPGMSSIGRRMAEPLTVTNEFRVAQINAQRVLIAEDGRTAGPFDVVVLALPAPQVIPMTAPWSDLVTQRAESVSYVPCLAAMVDFAAAFSVDYDAAFVSDSPLAWAARNSSKPGRPERECWVLHATPEWSRAHFEDSPADVAAALTEAWLRASGVEPEGPWSAAGHRWAFSLPGDPTGPKFVWDEAARIGACGDWCYGGRVEGAFASGVALARELVGRVRPNSAT